MSVLPNLYKFNTVKIKIPTSYLADMDKLILKFIERGKKTQNNQNNIEGKVESQRTETTQLQDLR